MKYSVIILTVYDIILKPLILSIILNLNTVFAFYFNYRLDFDMWCIDNCQELETGMLPIYVCFPFFVILEISLVRNYYFFLSG